MTTFCAFLGDSFAIRSRRRTALRRSTLTDRHVAEELSEVVDITTIVGLLSWLQSFVAITLNVVFSDLGKRVRTNADISMLLPRAMYRLVARHPRRRSGLTVNRRVSASSSIVRGPLAILALKDVCIFGCSKR